MTNNTSAPLYLALDQGGHSSRAIVVDNSGNIVAKAQQSVSTNRLDTDRVEQNPAELVESLKNCCNQIAEELGDAVTLIQTAGLATQRSSITCWEKDSGLPLTSVLSWQDRRARKFVDSLAPYAQQVKETTGLVLTPHYGASKIRWCLRKLEPVQAAAKKGNLVVGPLASFLIRQLTGEQEDFCDPANSSRTQLWDFNKRDWSQELCRLFEVDISLLPRSVPTSFSYGSVQVGNQSVPLSLVTGDQSAAIYAFGEPRADTLYINLGTGAFIQWPIGRTAQKIPGLLNSVVYQDESGAEYVLEGTVNGAGSALSWLAKQVNREPKALVVEGAAQAETELPPIFVNGVSGVGSPFWIPDLESTFIESALAPRVKTTSDGLKAIAVVESIAFLLFENQQRMKTLEKPIERILLTGGLASVDYLCQSLANICGTEVERSSVKEATAMGLAFLLAGDENRERQSVVFESKEDQELKHRYSIWKAHMNTVTE